MKKLYIILALVVVSFMMVFAGDTIKILRIYHNGTFIAIRLANIDNVEHSKYNANGKLQSNYTSSIIETYDSTYNIPINEIDSVVVTDADTAMFRNHTEEIIKYVLDQEEQPFNVFLENFLTWLNKCNFVSNARFNDEKVQIIILFKNGLDFFIDFQELDSISDYEESAKARNRNDKNDTNQNNYYDVTSKSGETILKPNILLIQGRPMLNLFLEPISSNAEEEFKLLNRVVSDSPTNSIVKRCKKSLNFFKEDFSNYGIIIISQTHGNRSGWFDVAQTDKTWITNNVEKENEYFNHGTHMGITLFLNKGYFYKLDGDYKDLLEDLFGKFVVYKVSPTGMGQIVSDNNIIHANYCWSYRLTDGINNATVFGHKETMLYSIEKQVPKDTIASHLFKMLNGKCYSEAIYVKPYNIEHKGNNLHLPATNREDSKQRYFSISTEDISDNHEIRGIIKGYENLKTKDSPNSQNINIIKNWVLYAHEGKKKFTPYDNNVKRVDNAYTPDADGNFVVSSNIVNQYPNHAFLVGFEYAGNVYYGEVKINICSDNNHPHIIDLGLPSGTKWCCCNVGSLTPFNIGLFYQWGDNEPYSEWSNAEYKYWNTKEHKECVYLGEEISGNPDYDGAMHYYENKHWRLPTKAECEELLKYCKAEEYNEVVEGQGRIKGVYLVSIINENRIFLPYYWNSGGGYWTGTAVPEHERTDIWPEIANFAAYSLVINEPKQTGNENRPFIGRDRRVLMSSIRPVYIDNSNEEK